MPDNQTIITPPAQNGDGGGNTVLIVIVIIILVVFGYWWYRHGRAPQPAPSGGTNINVTLPPVTNTGGTSTNGNTQP